MFKNNLDIILVTIIQMLIPKESSSFIQVNGTDYFIACRNKYLMIIYLALIYQIIQKLIKFK